ncbi:unknown [Clostridium sp. CAG:575]|nr:unknown [Clostridium sp. CAG:575]
MFDKQGFKEEKINNYGEEIEDTTMYGEFITSYFAWVPLSKQKEKVEELEKMTNKGMKSNINKKQE